MKKSTFYTLIRTKDGESIAQEKTGYTFSDHGYTFNLYKIGSAWCVLEASTGLQVCKARTLKEAPERVLGYIDTIKSLFSRPGEQLKEAIKIIADATNKAHAVDGEKKPEKNVIKRDTTILSGTILTDTAFNVKGDVVDVFKDRYGWTGINRRTGKIALFPASFLRNGEVFRIDAQRPEPTAENITRLLDAGNEEEARKELFTLLVVSGEHALAETDRAHGEILETDETKDLLEKIANEAEKTTAEYFAPVETETETATDGHKAPAPVKAAEPIPTDTETPATSAGTVRTEKTKPCTPCTMTAARRKWYNICGNVYRSGTEPNHGARLVKSILSGFNIHTLTSMHRTEKRGYMSATRSHKAICTRTGTPPGRTQNRTQSRTNCEVTVRGSPENIASLQALILAS